MRAIVFESGEETPTIRELPTPSIEAGEVLVRTLRVGIDGTDHEVIKGNHGGFPAGTDYLVLGHEAIGVVEDPGETAMERGTLVVPTVRRPPSDGVNEYFERGEPDMGTPGTYVERGIGGAHGFMAEYFSTDPAFLVPVPRSLADVGFLVEPISNVEKAMELARASRGSFQWSPETAIVLGNGPLGLLSLGLLAQQDEFSRLYGLGRRDRPDPTIDIIDRFGATYVDSRDVPVTVLPAAHEAVDLVLEATGYARHAFESMDALAPNGVGVLLGIPADWRFEIDGGRLHREFVLHNKALLGSVNSHIPHFEAAIQTLTAFPEWFTDALVTHVHSPEEASAAFEHRPDRIKTVVEFDTI